LFYGIERFIEKKLLPFICIILGFFKSKRPLVQNPERIIVMRFWGLGETILTLPMLKALRGAKPRARITVLCTPRNADAFFGQPFVDELRIIWTPSLPLLILANFRKYDLAIDTEPHFAVSAILSFFVARRSIGFDYGSRARLYDVNVHYNDRQHVVHTFCDLLSPLGIGAKPKDLVSLKYGEDAEKAVDARLEAAHIMPGRLLVGVHAFCGPTASWRAWPKERFTELIDRISAKYACTIILTGSGWESEKNREIIAVLKNSGNAYGVSNLAPKELFCLIRKYGLMISNDTGPLHVAAAQGVPTIGLFGPNTPERFGPFPPERHIAFYHQAAGHPVINVHLNEFRRCDGECMRLITVDEVFRGVGRLLKK
jgi:heptosyltransferase-2